MGKSLKENERIVTESQYTVTLLAKLPEGTKTKEILRTCTIRANSDAEAIGIAMSNFRSEERYMEWTIHNFIASRTGG